MTTDSNLEKSDIHSLLLNPEKQHILIEFLMRHSAVEIDDLAHLLRISADKLRDVRHQRDCLNSLESKKLVDCFCLWCGS